MINILLNFIIFTSFYYLIKSFKAISFQIKYYKKDNPLYSYLYSNMKIGEPETSIYTYISSKIPLFSMLEVNKIIDENEFPKYYNIKKSNTFKNISSLGYTFVSSNKDIYAQEKFILNLYDTRTKNYGEISLNDIDFVLGVNQYKKGDFYFINLGFPFYNIDEMKNKFNFISQLKQKDIIESYDWFIYFEDRIEQNEDEITKFENLDNLKMNLIIGVPPHFYNNNLFYKSQLLMSYSKVDRWFITFEDIYLIFGKNTEKERKIREYETEVEIYLDELVTYAPPYFLNYLNREFFSAYSDCHYEKWDEVYIYCDKSENFDINNLKKFPTFYFQNKDYNYTLELTYQDLFIEYNEKYYFLLLDSEEEYWKIGYPFFKKYQFVFNQDSKTIGFYNPNLPKEKESEDEEIDDGGDNKKNNDTKNDEEKRNEENKIKSTEGISIKTVIIIIVVVSIIFIGIGLMIGKFVFKKAPKKRAYEFEDNCDYVISENDDRNIN